MQPQRLLRLTLLIFLLLALISVRLHAATSKLDLRTGGVLDPCVYASWRANFRIDNHDSSAVNVNTLTVRWWFSSSDNYSAAGFLLYVYNSGGGYLGYSSITATQTVMGSTCSLDGRTANRYVDLTFSSFSIPAGGYASPNGGYLDFSKSGGGVFDAGCDDYSGTATGGFNESSRVALYQSSSLVCEYTDASTQDANSGVEPCSGLSGCGGASSPTPSPSPSPSRTPSASPGPSGTPTRTRTATPVQSPTATPTFTASPAVYQSPTSTPTPQMKLVKSVNTGVAVIGDTLTFYLDWSNDASAGVTYQLWDSVSPFISYMGCNGGCSYAGSVVRWSFAASAGSSGQVAFWGTINGAP